MPLIGPDALYALLTAAVILSSAVLTVLGVEWVGARRRR